MWGCQQTTKQPWALGYSQDDLPLRLAISLSFLPFADYLTFQLLVRMYGPGRGLAETRVRQNPLFP
jgi:hypothetical protein